MPRKILSYQTIVVPFLGKVNKVVSRDRHLFSEQLHGKTTHTGFANGVDWHVNLLTKRYRANMIVRKDRISNMRNKIQHLTPLRSSMDVSVFTWVAKSLISIELGEIEVNYQYYPSYQYIAKGVR